MKYHRKGQIFVISALLLIIVLIFSYSLETDNTYIVKTSRYNLLENIKYEACKIGTISNGSTIVSRYNSYETSVENYCTELGYNCDLTITNNTILPADTSLINHTMFDYHIDFVASGFVHETDFTC